MPNLCVSTALNGAIPTSVIVRRRHPTRRRKVLAAREEEYFFKVSLHWLIKTQEAVNYYLHRPHWTDRSKLKIVICNSNAEKLTFSPSIFGFLLRKPSTWPSIGLHRHTHTLRRLRDTYTVLNETHKPVIHITEKKTVSRVGMPGDSP